MQSNHSGRASAGFTLVELIVVLVIIGSVAGLVIPSVAALGRTTDMGVSAKTQQDIASNLQQFFVLQKRYPQGCDSLLVQSASPGDSARPNSTPGTPGTGTGTPTGVYIPKYANGQQISGMTLSNPGLVANLQLGTLTSGQSRSFTRAGFEYVFDHEVYDWTTGAGVVNSNDSGVLRRDLTGSAVPACVVDQVNNMVGIATNSGRYLLLRGLVPSELVPSATTPGTWDWIPEAGTQIVAVGIGPNCRLVPTTMLNTPVYPGADGSYYGRYIAFFRVFPTGERPQLVGVSDAYGRTSDYTIQQFNESLPNGARQG